LLSTVLLSLPAVLQAQLSYTDNGDGTATITGCDPNYNGALAIPGTTNGLTITSIGDEAFFGRTKLASITFPASITNIGIAAFNSCLSLTNVAIPASVTSIGDYAFFYCTSMTAISVDTANPSYSSVDGVLFNKDQTTLMQFPFGKAGSYAIPGSVIGIADEAFGINDHGYPDVFSGFFSCAGLTNLIIPGSVTNIGEYTFSRCRGLTSVTLSNGITSIGVEAFSWCPNLASVTIPGSVTSIGDLAFYYSGLANVTVPGSVTNLGLGAFAVCGNLTNVTLQDGVGSIGERAFNYCTNLTSITVRGSVINIGDYAFTHCDNLTSASLSSGVVSIGVEAFSWCPNLASVTIPGSVTSIGDVAFYYSGLANVTVPGSVTNLGVGAFAVCSSLTNAIIEDGVTSIGEAGFNFCTNLTSITIPDSITSIGEKAFWFCTALTTLTIPNNVTNIGSYAFSGCASLMNITVNADNVSYSSLDGVLFNEDQTVLIQFPGGRGGSYTVPGNVTSIGDHAFGSYDPNGYLFSYLPSCANLTSITIPDSVGFIGDSAFSSCLNLEGVFFYGNAPSSVDTSTFANTPGVTVYYLPGTTGWGDFSLYTERPTALWLPAMQTSGGSFGMRTNQFGFNINWASDHTVVVEACTNLTNPDWQPVQTNTLTTGSAYFSDPQWTNYPNRFYRLRSP